MNKNAAKHYQEQQILNATPAERIVLLYNGAIKFLLQAKVAIEEGNIQERFNNNKRACDIIFHLQATLDMEKGGEIAQNLFSLYGYMLRRLVEVDMKNEVEPIDDVVGKLRQLNASWQKIASGEVVPDASGGAKSDEDKPNKPTKTAIA